MCKLGCAMDFCTLLWLVTEQGLVLMWSVALFTRRHLHQHWPYDGQQRQDNPVHSCQQQRCFNFVDFYRHNLNEIGQHGHSTLLIFLMSKAFLECKSQSISSET